MAEQEARTEEERLHDATAALRALVTGMENLAHNARVILSRVEAGVDPGADPDDGGEAA